MGNDSIKGKWKKYNFFEFLLHITFPQKLKLI